MKFVGKLGKTLGAMIGKDMKMRTNVLDPEGPDILRKPVTWQEAHAVIKEHEAEEAGNKALQKAYAQTHKDQTQDDWWAQSRRSDLVAPARPFL